MHHLLWGRTSNDRRYMLLDGFEAPNAGGRSVASVVRATSWSASSATASCCRWHRASTSIRRSRQDIENPIDLLEHYQPNTPIEPCRIAIPTRGVYAEAVMGACNSCERKEEERVLALGGVADPGLSRRRSCRSRPRRAAPNRPI